MTPKAMCELVAAHLELLRDDEVTDPWPAPYGKNDDDDGPEISYRETNITEGDFSLLGNKIWVVPTFPVAGDPDTCGLPPQQNVAVLLIHFLDDLHFDTRRASLGNAIAWAAQVFSQLSAEFTVQCDEWVDEASIAQCLFLCKIDVRP